jgi:hypothetical protein
MPEDRIFSLTSREGFGTVVNGNLVAVRVSNRVHSSGFSASVAAFQLDVNYQCQKFDTAADAVSWAVATAVTHQGEPRPISKIEYREIRDGHSITISRVDVGVYESETYPMWQDSEPELMRNFKRFPTLAEALDWARGSVDEQSG